MGASLSRLQRDDKFVFSKGRNDLVTGKMQTAPVKGFAEACKIINYFSTKKIVNLSLNSSQRRWNTVKSSLVYEKRWT